MANRFVVEGEELLQKEAKHHGTGAIVYVPKAWLGRKVAVILLPEK